MNVNNKLFIFKKHKNYGVKLKTPNLGKFKLMMRFYSSICIVALLDVFEFLHCNNS